MAAKFRKVDPRVWCDEKFSKLDAEDKLLALYCLTSPQVNRIGLFRFSLALAAEDLGTLPQTFAKRFDVVCGRLNWCYDFDAKVMYFPTWWKYNRPDNPNILVNCLDDLHDVPASPLIAEFYANVRYLPETFVERFHSTIGNVTPNVTPNVSLQEQEQEQEQDKEPPIAPQGAKDNGYCQSFIEWWEHYPRKVGKDAAYRAWKKAGAKLKAQMVCSSHEAAAYLLKQVASYSTARRGKDQQFTPNPSTWLNQGRWADDPATWLTDGSGGKKKESGQSDPVHVPSADSPEVQALYGTAPDWRTLQ